MSLPFPSTGKIDPAMLQAMDAPLIELAQKSGGDLRKLMFSFFSFLNRRTDFYCVNHPDDQGAKMGFKEGDAEKMLLAAFRQFPLRRVPRSSVAPKPVEQNVGAGGQPSTIPKLVKSKKPDQKKSDWENAMEKIRLSDNGKQIPVGNGGATDKYRWTQTIEETTVVMAVPDGTRGKDLDVKIKSSSVSVKHKKVSPDKQNMLEGNLFAKIQPDESTWSLEGGALLLVLQKVKNTWWENVVEGDGKIDTELVDSRRKIGEYDSATQGAIRRIIFDQQQESLGQPTSKQILESEGKDNPIPPLPDGVEYIDKKKLDEASSGK